MTSPERRPDTEDSQGRWRFAIDRGGTFTDIIGFDPEGGVHAIKLPSESNAYPDAAIAGIRRLLGDRGAGLLPQERIGWIRMGSTVATNALLERKGIPTGLLITGGFRDLLEIGTQQRPELFALAIRKPERLYQAVAEAEERMGADGQPLREPDPDRIRAALEALKRSGARSLAIVFLHAWKNPAHELLAEQLARQVGFDHMVSSHRTLRLIQVVGRGQTTLVDAYLTPVLLRYTERIRQWTGAIPLHFMSSSGALFGPETFSGKDAILSGPAGGALGAAAAAEAAGASQAIGFDMGGTSTDVCRFDGQLERILEVETAGVRFQAPMIHVETVAAGGGSILHFDGRKLSVGPDSAGADPGPACYGLGGPAAITDANLILGRIAPDHFPRVFGPNRDAPLDLAASRQRLAEIRERMAVALGEAPDLETLALGFVRIANETMARPIRKLSTARGYDPREHLLVCFGGAGGQHACGIARSLGIRQTRIHPLSGLLSAYGIGLAPHRREQTLSLLTLLDADGLSGLTSRGAQVADALERELRVDAGLVSSARLERRLSLDLRTPGTDAALTIPLAADLSGLGKAFRQAHRRLYGFDPPSEGALEAVNLRVAVFQPRRERLGRSPVKTGDGSPPVAERATLWFDPGGPVSAPVIHRSDLRVGRVLAGPALIVEPNATVVVEPGFELSMDGEGVLVLTLVETFAEHFSERLDPVALELFNHRFMGVAEQMGETLVGAAHSVNIKERRDFSCAVFDHLGRLVANAPHIPVHLGAMGETVGWLIREKGCDMRPGDVFVSNDPDKGGSHLPDVTVISPLFRDGWTTPGPAFFVATRGHHADMGGIVPGSLPPFARSLREEGVVLSNLLAARAGVFQESAVREALTKGSYPARNLVERLSDLRAQMAANQRGLEGLSALCDAHGDAVVAAYMDHMRANAEAAMGEALEKLLGEGSCREGRFEDWLDDGTLLRVRLRIERTAGGGPRALVDFAGTAPRHAGNLNAPPAVTRAAVLYVFRTLVHQEIPLNDGCLAPIEIRIPPDSLLDPGPDAAVSGGNVETSQRVVDLLYGALGIAAASQGTMNNFLFGRADGQGGQYYETIAGGAGAVSGCAGASGVQVHMTNTRITDPEVLETRFPELRLESFSLRRGSGGAGRWPGGEGVIRSFRFSAPMEATLLSQRRVRGAFGLEGGGDGAPGRNFLLRANGERVALPGLFQGRLEPGEGIEIHTPGGGGFGRLEPGEGVESHTPGGGGFRRRD